MRYVEAAVIKPHRCAVLPFVGGHDDEGYIDTGSEMDGFDNHVYVSVKAIKEMARLIGLPTRQEHADMVAEANRVARLLEQTVKERDDAQRVLDAIDAIESADFRRRRRAGRRPHHNNKPDAEEVAA